jgi:DMSO reductase anchor subunit
MSLITHGLVFGISILLIISGLIGFFILLAVKTKDSNSISKIVAQVTSARWILTVLAGISFLLFSASVVIVIVHQRDKIEPALAVSMMANLLILVQSVYNMYFHRKDGGNGNGLNPNSDNTFQDNLQAKPPEQKPNA